MKNTQFKFQLTDGQITQAYRAIAAIREAEGMPAIEEEASAIICQLRVPDLQNQIKEPEIEGLVVTRQRAERLRSIIREQLMSHTNKPPQIETEEYHSEPSYTPNIPRPTIGECQELYERLNIRTSTHTEATTSLCHEILKLQAEVKNLNAQVTEHEQAWNKAQEVWKKTQGIHIPRRNIRPNKFYTDHLDSDTPSP